MEDSSDPVRTGHSYKQFIKFCLIGVVNTAIDLCLYYLLTRHLGLQGELIYLAKVLSFFAATLNSFVLNTRWTFTQTAGAWHRGLLRYYLVISSGAFINVGIHVLNVHIFGLNDILSGAISALFSALWGFSLLKYFIFA